MSRIILIVAMFLVFGACAAKRQTIGNAFPQSQLALIESQLKQGISTKSDVQQLLGPPGGLGGAFFPVMSGQTAKLNEAWYYQDAEVTDTSSKGGVIRMNLRQQVLLVFFYEDKFDGFMWYSNVDALVEAFGR
ncbi:MAG TPA: hypothetical protein EYG65_09830 [Rhodospirillales bacterium]|nr:hypothetical protein [Rhodospirillales bacterium]